MSWLTRAHACLLLRLSSLVALVYSAISAVDYYGPIPTFCASGAGCDLVAKSSVGEVLGPFLPALGLVTYTFLFIVSFFRQPRFDRLIGLAALLAGIGAFIFILIQAFFIDAFCWICMGVDIAAIVAAGAGMLLWRGPAELRPPSRLPLVSWAAIYILAVAGAPVWMLTKPPSPVPDAVRALWVDGKINVVEISDFNCPFCRKLHPVLMEALEPYGDRVHVKRLLYPLGGLEGAMAHLCAEDQKLQDAFAHAMFELPAKSNDEILAYVKKVGMDPDAFMTCMNDQATMARLRDVIDTVRSVNFRGAPTLWIGERESVGFDPHRTPERIADALKAEDESLGVSRVPWFMILLCSVVVILFGLGFVLRRKRRDNPSSDTPASSDTAD